MKKINFKKAAALLTAGVMTMSVFASCGKSANDTDENGKSDPSDATDNKKDDNSGNKDADTGNYIDSNCSSNCSSDCSDRNGFIYPEEKETEVEL